MVVARTGSYYLAFLIASAMLVLGALSYLILVGQISPLQWAEDTPERRDCKV
jgi:hypothetical protein